MQFKMHENIIMLKIHWTVKKRNHQKALLPVSEWSPFGPEEGSFVVPLPSFQVTILSWTVNHSQRPLSKLHVRPLTAGDKELN